MYFSTSLMEKGLKAVSLTSAIYCKSDKANVTICHCPPCGYIYLLLNIYIYIFMLAVPVANNEHKANDFLLQHEAT